MKNLFQWIGQIFNNEPTSPRTAETSEVQDIIVDVMTRTPERKEFEKKAQIGREPRVKNKG